jgi:hypothetical protein
MSAKSKLLLATIGAGAVFVGAGAGSAGAVSGESDDGGNSDDVQATGTAAGKAKAAALRPSAAGAW